MLSCHGSKICKSQQTLVLQIWQNKNKQKSNHTHTHTQKKTTLLCTITLRNKTVARTFLASVACENKRFASSIAAGGGFARRNVYDSVTEIPY